MLSAVAAPSTTSHVITILAREIRETFPETQSKRLAAHEDAIARTTRHHDGRRAWRCATWAIETAGERDLPHPEWRRIKELHAVWRDITWGVGWASETTGVGRPAPLRDVEVEWVEDAAQVARIVGEAVGWAHVPWEALVVELIEMDPGATDAAGS